jgi:hypothetical protein
MRFTRIIEWSLLTKKTPRPFPDTPGADNFHYFSFSFDEFDCYSKSYYSKTCATDHSGACANQIKGLDKVHPVTPAFHDKMQEKPPRDDRPAPVLTLHKVHVRLPRSNET